MEDNFKKARWAAAWSTLSAVDVAIKATMIAHIGTDGYTKGNNRPRQSLATLATERQKLWDDYNKMFNFVTFDGRTEMFLPSTQVGATQLVATTTASPELDFITKPDGGACEMSFKQALCLWMSQHNSFNATRHWARAYGIVAANGHPIYFSKPADLTNAAIWHGVANTYNMWCDTVASKPDYSQLTITARLLKSWGFTNLHIPSKVNNQAGSAKTDLAMLRATAPVHSAMVAHIDINVLEAARDDIKRISTHLDQHIELMKKTKEKKACPPMEDKDLAVFRKSGQWGKGLGKA
jgi:hypothetical protein